MVRTLIDTFVNVIVEELKAKAVGEAPEKVSGDIPRPKRKLKASRQPAAEKERAALCIGSGSNLG